MKKSFAKVWRGLLALFLSLSIGLLNLIGVVNTWRSVIDQKLGTISTKTTNDDKFVSEYKTTDELVKAHVDLGELVGEEGVVLLKNENSTLPLAEKPKVTLFGMGSMYSFLGGTMGSTVEGAGQRDMVAALEEKGFAVNPTMVSIYKNLGEIVTGERKTFRGAVPVHGYRPANFATPYEPSEPAMDMYTAPADQHSGKAEANYQDSFKEYNDAAIVVISRPGSEGSDYYPGEAGIDTKKYEATSALGLVANERALIETAKKHFDKVIVMINSGSTMEIEELKQDKDIDALMYIGFPGAYGFLGIADILNGTVSPSGHLADTYPVDNAKSPAAQNFGKIAINDLSAITAPDSLMPGLAATSPLGSFGGDPSMSADHYVIQAEGIYTGYKYYETRYFDTVMDQGNAKAAVGVTGDATEWNYDNEVSYPFGFGLSYTTFEQTLDSVKVDTDEQTITAEVTVKNTGDQAGKSVAQLYAQAPYTDYDKEHKVEKAAVQLLGFAKTQELAPGASEKLTITVDLKYLGSWDSTAKDGRGGYILDGGKYYFAIGNGAHAAVNNVLTAQGKTDVGGVAEMVKEATIGKEGEVDETTLSKSENGTEVVNQLADADINYYQPGYATYLTRNDWEKTFPKTYNDLTIGGEKQEEWVKNLSNEVYQIQQGEAAEVKGSGGSLKLADMAGNDDINDPKWDELVAQIPLDTLFAKIVKGGSVSDVIPEIGSPLVFQNDGPNGFGSPLSARGLNKDDKNAEFSMGTMANEVILASTFNQELVREWGRLIGNDGLWSGNWSIWGVAANLHRSAFNGRNFEYYSEDPMLSNYMAAATVGGAYEYGVLIGAKHFAFNDQETQRSGVAPYMTEQKAREGELRAFQGIFEEAQALAAMTSFSRIGATPVNGSKAVLINILRGEWGFKGLLSTDMVNNPGYFRPEMCIAAGITMMADFSTDETMTQVGETWPYMTTELLSKDAELIKNARQNMKYQLYAFAHSAAQNVKTEKVTPWWETALYVVIYGGFALSALLCAGFAVSTLKNRKEEQ